MIDPTGLALENFDSIGRWRTTDPQAENAADRCQHRAAERHRHQWHQRTARTAGKPSRDIRSGVHRKAHEYAINRELEYFDMPQVRAVVRGAAKDTYTLSSLVLGIVHTDAFRKQAPAPAPKASVAKAVPANTDSSVLKGR